MIKITYPLSAEVNLWYTGKLMKAAALIPSVISVKEEENTSNQCPVIVLEIEDTMTKEDIFMLGVLLGGLEYKYGTDISST